MASSFVWRLLPKLPDRRLICGTCGGRDEPPLAAACLRDMIIGMWSSFVVDTRVVEQCGGGGGSGGECGRVEWKLMKREAGRVGARE